MAEAQRMPLPNQNNDLDRIIKDRRRDLERYLRIPEFLDDNPDLKSIVPDEKQEIIINHVGVGADIQEARVFLDEFLKSQNPRKWGAMRNALRSSGHELAYDIVCGASLYCRKQREKLVLEVFNRNINGVFNGVAFSEMFAFSTSERQKIQCQLSHNGDTRPIPLILRIMIRHKTWFPDFLRILRETDKHDIAGKLEKSDPGPDPSPDDSPSKNTRSQNVDLVPYCDNPDKRGKAVMKELSSPIQETGASGRTSGNKDKGVVGASEGEGGRIQHGGEDSPTSVHGAQTVSRTVLQSTSGELNWHDNSRVPSINQELSVAIGGRQHSSENSGKSACCEKVSEIIEEGGISETQSFFAEGSKVSDIYTNHKSPSFNNSGDFEGCDSDEVRGRLGFHAILQSRAKETKEQSQRNTSSVHQCSYDPHDGPRGSESCQQAIPFTNSGINSSLNSFKNDVVTSHHTPLTATVSHISLQHPQNISLEDDSRSIYHSMTNDNTAPHNSQTQATYPYDTPSQIPEPYNVSPHTPASNNVAPKDIPSSNITNQNNNQNSSCQNSHPKIYPVTSIGHQSVSSPNNQNNTSPLQHLSSDGSRSVPPTDTSIDPQTFPSVQTMPHKNITSEKAPNQNVKRLYPVLTSIDCLEQDGALQEAAGVHDLTNHSLQEPSFLRRIDEQKKPKHPEQRSSSSQFHIPSPGDRHAYQTVTTQPRHAEENLGLQQPADRKCFYRRYQRKYSLPPSTFYTRRQTAFLPKSTVRRHENYGTFKALPAHLPRPHQCCKCYWVFPTDKKLQAHQCKKENTS